MTMNPGHMSAVFGRRTCAVLAACSAVLHSAMVGHTGAIASIVTVGMAVACLYCAYELWTDGSIRAWLGVAVMNLVMVGAHLSVTSGHHHGGDVLAARGIPTLMAAATSLAVVEALIATAVLYARTRNSRLVLLRQ